MQKLQSLRELKARVIRCDGVDERERTYLGSIVHWKELGVKAGWH